MFLSLPLILLAIDVHLTDDLLAVCGGRESRTTASLWHLRCNARHCGESWCQTFTLTLALLLCHFHSHDVTFKEEKLKFAGPRDFEGGNTRKAFVDSMLKAEQV